MTAVAVERTEGSRTLRCHSCSHAVGVAFLPMRLVGMFRASFGAQVPRTHDEEVRKRCNACGWVNVFHPATEHRTIELK